MKRQITSEPLEPLIYRVRDKRVLLDADLARLYGVKTFRFNEAFKRNRKRFPQDFAFRLTDEEFASLRARPDAPDMQPPDLSIESTMSSQFAMRYSRRRPASHRPWAFTEHGALMAANILRSDRAVQMSVFVVRADPPKRRIGFHGE
ncbi:MAG TPA: ORF6N domain-containing protein [Burkholderiales bacterium]|nr:ORF6N domain-containing protein [Burkholderiales bacterium]